jgi:hypothetical protein
MFHIETREHCEGRGHAFTSPIGRLAVLAVAAAVTIGGAVTAGFGASATAPREVAVIDGTSNT